MSQQLVPILLGILAAFVAVFSLQRLSPHITLHRVLKAIMHVVAGTVTEVFEGSLHT